MHFRPTSLRGAWLIELQPARDERGFFARTFCVHEFSIHGLETSFPQHSISVTPRRGTLRGMHFQRKPHAEVKLIRCIKGKIWDVIIDLRPDSPTFCSWQSFELSAENRRQLYIPKGFAHGFQTLTDDVDVSYLISEMHVPEATNGVRHDDPAFQVEWPLAVTMISDKDRSWPAFARQST
jgi:dTDP-4-dehydrorhamnose 3,5-epimerase